MKKKVQTRRMVATALLALLACTVLFWLIGQGGADAAQLTASAAPGKAETASNAQAAQASGPWHNVKFYGILIFAGLTALWALLSARKYYGDVLKAAPGNETMQRIAGSVREGAYAYLRRQRNIVMKVLVVVGLLVAFGANYHYIKEGQPIWAVIIFFGFLTGGICSFLTGWFGMGMATQASNRTAWACTDKDNGLNSGLQIAFKAGSVMGLSVVGLGLAFIVAWLAALSYYAPDKPALIGEVMVSFGMGASFVALFARVGGGIFTKAADVGADLVGKVEAGIPEDDPRNPATIADNVGDNVGDVAGMGADLYESYCGAILAAMALAFFAAKEAGNADVWAFIAAPIAIAACGIVLSRWGTTLVKTKERASLKELLGALHRGVNSASYAMIPATFAVCYFCFEYSTAGAAAAGQDLWWRIAVATVLGMLSGLVIAWGSERYTAYDYTPTQRVGSAATTGPATVIIAGLAAGMMSTWIPIVVVALATAAAYGVCFGFDANHTSLGLYGISVAAVGMLSTLGITLATDAYGPIADNAGGNAEMSGLDPSVRQRTDALDSLGNTTAAIGKGFAIGSAALTALALIATYYTFSVKANDHITESLIALNQPMVIAGLFIGTLLVFVFCAMTMTAVGNAALAMVNEVRRQFREIPGILEGKATPDYARCVDISTTGALREMIVPSLLAVVVPVVVGVLFGVGGVIGMLAGGLGTGFAMAIFMANAGGSWDNAKKWIEKGELGGKYLKNDKGEYVDAQGNKVDKKEKAKNPCHGAAVIGDTVGDPFKDTSGPSLNILIKLISMVSVATIAITLAVNEGRGLFEMLFTSFGK